MTAPDPEAQRIRSYLVTQANRLTIPELVEKMTADALQLRDAAAAVPPADFNDRPGADEWSAAEVLTHVLEMTERGAESIEGILDHGAIPPRMADQISGETRSGLQTAADYWQAFTARRELLYARVLGASGDEHLEIPITHPNFGPFSWREWLLFMRVHDLDHMRQLQAITAHFGGAGQSWPPP